MGREVKCPRCGNQFHLHGRGTMWDSYVTECYRCSCIFNPRKQSDIPI